LLAASLAAGAWSGATGAWSGYVVKSGATSEIAATFTVPTMVQCQSWPDGGTNFWVGIQSTDGNGNATIVADGITIGCASGQPMYYAWTYSSDSQQEVLLPDPVQPLDTVTATVTEAGATIAEAGGTYTMALNDTVQGWSESSSTTGGAASSNWSAVAASSFNGGASSEAVAVTGAQVNGAPLGQSNPEADEQGPDQYNGMVGLDPSGLDASGQAFSFSWNGPPNDLEVALRSEIGHIIFSSG
jgi:hypothetical protein